MSKLIKLILLFTFTTPSILFAESLPTGFVYLRDVDPSIQQEMRYAGAHNFIGHPITGYAAEECILTKDAATALTKIQAKLKKSSHSLKVYDCYRPQKAVDEFITWSNDPHQQQMKTEFYPRVNKADFFKLGYVAEKSGHTRGSTVDLTIVPIPVPQQKNYRPGEKLISCFAAKNQRFPDNSVDMGTGYDCMDELAHGDNKNISEKAQQNRLLLSTLMIENGFDPYAEEWWHFTLKNEPYPKTYFNFDVKQRSPLTALGIHQSQQLLLVQSQKWNAVKGELQRYQRDSDKQDLKKVGLRIPVVLGKNGIVDAAMKKEGDLRTPAGIFNIVRAFGFETKPKLIHLPFLQITENDVCVDDPTSTYYNQLIDQSKISKPDWHSSEKMRQTELYKIGAVISYNQIHPLPGHGSCIFLHVWRNPAEGTSGCVAMSAKDLKTVLYWLEPKKHPVIALT